MDTEILTLCIICAIYYTMPPSCTIFNNKRLWDSGDNTVPYVKRGCKYVFLGDLLFSEGEARRGLWTLISNTR